MEIDTDSYLSKTGDADAIDDGMMENDIEESRMIFDERHSEDMRKRRSRSKVGSVLCHTIVDKMQSIRLPKWLCRSYHTGDGVLLIHGLDRVIFGTSPASESILVCGIKPVRYVWYMLAGSCCDMLQLLIDLFLNQYAGIEDASICWSLGFALSIIARHTAHRYLTFGDYVGGYWYSLLRMYGGYSVIIVISTVFNIIMTKTLKVSHYVAWIVTLLWTGIVNYFILKYLWTFGGNNTPSLNNNNNNLTMNSLSKGSSSSGISLMLRKD